MRAYFSSPVARRWNCFAGLKSTIVNCRRIRAIPCLSKASIAATALAGGDKEVTDDVCSGEFDADMSSGQGIDTDPLELPPPFPLPLAFPLPGVVPNRMVGFPLSLF